MSAASLGPSLVGRLNERRVLQLLQGQGPLSRAEVTRGSGLSAPTVSKAVAALLSAGLLEETEAEDLARGRPAKKLRLASQKAQVLGLVLDVGHCRLVAAGLDGQFASEGESLVPTPKTYAGLLDVLSHQAQELMQRPGFTTLGIGVSVPGLIDYRRQEAVLSPNLPQTDGHSPAADLSRRLGVACVMFQESHALCLAERHYGLARGFDDFAILDVSTGVGMGVMSSGRLLTGHRGLAGEIGHIAVVDGGRTCGCGNRGCLETVAGDSALAWRVSQRLRRPVDIEEVIRLARTGKISLEAELTDSCRFLAVGVAAVINLFNPATLFLHGRLFEADDQLFPRVIELTRKRALGPSFADCRMVRAQGSKLLGAVAGAIQHLTSAIAPTLRTDFPHASEGPVWAAGN